MQKKLVLLISILFFSLFSCKKEETPVEPKVYIDFSGNVFLYNENGKLSDHSGVTVTIESSGQKSTTDAAGNWSIKNVEKVRQTISFSKIGYGTNKEVGLLVVDNADNYIRDKELHQLPTFNVQNLQATIVSGGILVTGKISSSIQNKMRIVVIYFGKDNSVSFSPSKWVIKTSAYINPDSTSFGEIVGFADLLSNGVSAGSKIYAVAHTTTGLAEVIKYTDGITGKEVYSCLNSTPSNIVEISMP